MFRDAVHDLEPCLHASWVVIMENENPKLVTHPRWIKFVVECLRACSNNCTIDGELVHPSQDLLKYHISDDAHLRQMD